jgi:predicted RNase H-like nuclease (RuvC/YqgF family)
VDRQYVGGSAGNAACPPPAQPVQPVQPVQAAESEHIPVLGARKFAEELQRENHELKRENQELRQENQDLKVVVDRLGAMSVIEAEAEMKRLTTEVDLLRSEKSNLETALNTEKSKLENEIQQARSELVETQGLVQMQDVGLYQYQLQQTPSR